MGGVDWAAEKDEILYRYCKGGESASALAKEYGVHHSNMSRHLRAWGTEASDRGNPLKYYEIQGVRIDELDEAMPVLRPVRFQYGPSIRPPPSLPKPDPRATEMTSLHWSDVHFPFEDPRALEILYQVALRVRPGVLVAQGDLLDLWQISDHRPPLEQKLKPHQIDIQKGIDQLAEHLRIMIELAAPGVRRIYLHGNHEDRFDRLLADLQLNPKTLALMRIPKIREALSLDYILGLEEGGWETHSYLEGDRLVLHDRLLCIHGYRTTKYATASHLTQYGKSVVFGHSHRIQNFTSRDLRGTDSGWNMGCLCDLNPHWRSRPDWHQGFAVVTWKRSGDEWFFNLEQVRIHDGVAIFRDKFYRG